MPARKDIAKAMKEAEKLMDIAGVEGVGQGQKNGQDCIKVFCSFPAKEIKKQIPKKIQGYEVVIEFSGPIQAWGTLS